MDAAAKTVWYIEAREWVDPKPDGSGYAPADPGAMGSAVAVYLEKLKDDGTPYDSPDVKKYLLTCGHVIRKDATSGNARKGWGPILTEICCFPPGRQYLRTRENVRRSGDHDGACLAHVVEKRSAMEGSVTTDVPSDVRLEYHDWVLLDVRDPDFQDCDVAPIRPDWTRDEKVGIIGYPGGAGTLANPIWNKFTTIKSFTPGEFHLHRDPPTRMVMLDGTEAAAGMSGGGVFAYSDGALLGLHRSSIDGALAKYGVSMKYICEELFNRWRMRPFVGPVRAPGALDVCDSLLPSADPIRPFINRETLRKNLRRISRPESQHKAVSLLGPSGSGKTWSQHLIQRVAEEHKLGLTVLNLSGGQALDKACIQITRDLGLVVKDMRENVLDDQATGETTGQKFAGWLIATTRKAKDVRRFILMVDEIMASDGARSPLYEELVLPIMDELRRVLRSKLLLILAGESFPTDGGAADFVLHEQLEPLTPNHIRDYVQECFKRKGRPLSPQLAADIFLDATKDVPEPYDRAKLEVIVGRIKGFLEAGIL